MSERTFIQGTSCPNCGVPEYHIGIMFKDRRPIGNMCKGCGAEVKFENGRIFWESLVSHVH